MTQEIPDERPDLMKPPAMAASANHGRTLAGWVLFWGACIGVLVAGVGAATFNKVTIIVAVGILVAAVLASVVLRMMGHGQPRPERAVPSVEDPYR